ncbi:MULTISPECIES: ribonuclease HI family protein [unclassified Caballeronia]|uniref:ribonuclease HI family protein n=1 Tax=unclassified Caballeronia TaxID=2646786 RepID=UPI00285B9945|nr:MULTISPECIES: ribonuclease HI family protein [unclassified Caballeronia]MDR5738688.1 ribonuclease HI family protein [Caballeronia sp. LZ016]MDR5811443.1 ribonuclease HI family protein [Caballeronia sp. LZ019]
MVELHELLAVAYRKERLRSRRLEKHAGLSEHAALVRTLEQAAAGQPLRELIVTRRAAQAKAAEARRTRQLERANRTKRRPASGDSSARHCDAWIGWFDGSALPNPGRLGIGGLLKAPHGRSVEISATAGVGDSSAAEYFALIALLEAALREGATRLVIYGDSRVVIDDVAAPEGAGSRSLADHAARVRALIAQIGDVRLQWIPRARNADADRLSRQALGLPALRAA